VWIDKIVLLLLIFFVTFSWLRYYKYGMVVAVLGGVLLSTLTHVVLNFLFRTRRERKNLEHMKSSRRSCWGFILRLKERKSGWSCWGKRWIREGRITGQFVTQIPRSSAN